MEVEDLRDDKNVGGETDRLQALIEQYHSDCARLSFLDANLWIGRSLAPGFADAVEMTSLSLYLSRYRIAGGIVSHFASKEYDPIWGNEEAMHSVAATTLWAGIVVVPEMFETADAGRAYITEAINRRTRLARVFPHSHHYTLAEWCSGVMLETLQEARLPLAIWHTQVAWAEIRALCQTYPRLPIIVEGTPQKILYHNRIYRVLLEEHSNLHLELHNLSAYLELEYLVDHFGAQQLVFGTYLPVFDPNVAMMMVTHARVAEADKLKIAHQNLQSLMAGVRQL